MLLRRAFWLANAGRTLRITEKAIARLLAEVGSHATAPAGQDLLRACFQLADGERAGGEYTQKHGCKKDFLQHRSSPFEDNSVSGTSRPTELFIIGTLLFNYLLFSGRCWAFRLASAHRAAARAKTTAAWTFTDVAAAAETSTRHNCLRSGSQLMDRYSARRKSGREHSR